MKLTVLSLCDFTGNMVRPWAEAGYQCACVDVRHTWRKVEGNITFIPLDINNLDREKWDDYFSQEQWRIVFGFPPCTNLAVSGARWFKDKGLRGLIDGLRLVEKCREIAEWSGASWALENPVSTLSSYWRKPDYIFHPYEYAGYEGGENDAYTKKTCLWTGGGFVMPEKKPLEITRPGLIHRMPPSDERGNLRSVTPMGFARAVFQANHKVTELVAADAAAKGEANGG